MWSQVSEPIHSSEQVDMCETFKQTHIWWREIHARDGLLFSISRGSLLWLQWLPCKGLSILGHFSRLTQFVWANCVPGWFVLFVLWVWDSPALLVAMDVLLAVHPWACFLCPCSSCTQDQESEPRHGCMCTLCYPLYTSSPQLVGLGVNPKMMEFGSGWFSLSSFRCLKSELPGFLAFSK